MRLPEFSPWRLLRRTTARPRLRCLFVTHKWGDAAPGTGESVTVRHLIDTFVEWGGGDHQILWTDETTQRGCDLVDAFTRAARCFAPDVVVYTPITAEEHLHLNIGPDVMRSVGAASVTVLFDHAMRHLRSVLQPIVEVSSLCVNLDGCREPIGTNYLSLWPACTKRTAKPKTIDLSFLGSRKGYPDRIKAMQILEAEGIDIVVKGGRGENIVGEEEYLETLDRSAVTLNFCKSFSGEPQIKARVIEGIASGCCLVEDRNAVTRRFLDPGKEYLQFKALEQLPDLLRMLQRDRSRVLAIGERGRRAFEDRLSAARFWQKITAAL